jgi:hypothetical protein
MTPFDIDDKLARGQKTSSGRQADGAVSGEPTIDQTAMSAILEHKSLHHVRLKSARLVRTDS